MSINGYYMQDWLGILIFVHVVCSIVGIGPTYFGHILLRKKQTLAQLRSSLYLAKWLEMFPKILGSLAVISGLLLAWLGDYGFGQFWIYGSIALYVLIQAIVIAYLAPATEKLADTAAKSTDPDHEPVKPEIAASLLRLNRMYYLASGLGLLLFLFMFFKPEL